MFTLDNLFLLITSLLAAYLCWYFWQRYSRNKALHNLYYLMGFAVLFVSGLLLISQGLDSLSSPYVLTVASLIPLGISIGLVEEYYPRSPELVMQILTPLLLLMTLAFTIGFTRRG